MTLDDKARQIQESLANKEYRDALAIEHVNTTLAIQIRRMRENRQWKQSNLADRLGKHQEAISQWENPDYGRYSLTTLKELAAAFDVALLVKFIPFSELVKDMVNISPIRLCPPSFGEEPISAAAPISSATSTVADEVTNFLKYHAILLSTGVAGPYDGIETKEAVHAGK